MATLQLLQNKHTHIVQYNIRKSQHIDNFNDDDENSVERNFQKQNTQHKVESSNKNKKHKHKNLILTIPCGIYASIRVYTYVWIYVLKVNK